MLLSEMLKYAMNRTMFSLMFSDTIYIVNFQTKIFDFYYDEIVINT